MNKNIKFRAVSNIPVVEMEYYNIPHNDAVVIGNLINNNMIVGDIIRREDGSRGFEWTCTVFEGTIEPVFKISFKDKVKYIIVLLTNKTWIK